MIPETSNRADWPRLVKMAFDQLNRRLSAEEAQFVGLGNYADDVAAAAGGVPIGSFYLTGSTVKQRVS